MSADVHTRTQCPPAPTSFYVTASWPMYIPAVSYLSTRGNHDLTNMAGCQSPNLCHSFTQHPSAATTQPLLQSSGWPHAEWEEEKVDYYSFSLLSCWNKPWRYFQLFVSLMCERICPSSAPCWGFAHNCFLPRGTGGALHVSEVVLGKMAWATWPIIKGC